MLAGLDVADGDEGPLSQPGPTESPEATGDAAPAGNGEVPESCLRAAEYNDTLTQAIDDIAVGVRDQDARALQETLDLIQEAQPEGEAASQECQELAGTADASTEPEESEEGEDAEETAEPTQDASPEPTEGEPSPAPTP